MPLFYLNLSSFTSFFSGSNIVVIACIEEFQRNSWECHITNQQLCEMFHEDVNAIKRCLKKLEAKEIISRSTSFVGGSGRGNRQRSLTINEKWLSGLGAPDGAMEGSESADGRLKTGEWKGHNEPIKDNIKDNKI